MTPALILAAIAAAAVLSAIGARRDLGAPMALTLAMFAAVSIGVGAAFGLNHAPTAALALVCVLIAETDRRHHLIPDLFVLALLALSVVTPFVDHPMTRLIGALALGATFLFARQLGSAWRGGEALGLGDVKLAAAMGAALGPVLGFTAVAIAGAATLLTIAARARGGAAALGAPFGVGLAGATFAVALVWSVAP